MKKLILTLSLIAGSGFAAKNICSGYFLSGMFGQQIVDEALIPAS